MAEKPNKPVQHNMFTWKLHGDGKHLGPGEVVAPDERLTWGRTAGIGAQHVIAMFGATFLVPILTGFDPSTTLFFTAMSTALFLLINKNKLPSYLGSSFGFIAPITAVTARYTGLNGIARASFGIMCTGITLALIGLIVHFAGSKWIDIIMPPIVTGAIVSIIGFNLAPSVWNNWNAKTPKGATASSAATAAVTLAAVLLISVLFRGLIGRLNILLGVIVGYIFAICNHQVDFTPVEKAAWIGWPSFHLPVVDWSVLAMFIPVVLVLIAENVGHVKSVALMTGRNYDDQIGMSLFADGLGTTLAGFGGGSGTTTYAENIGVMAATKVYSSAAYWFAAAFAFILSLCPKFGAIINTIPSGVLGGVTTLLYGMIGMLGVRIWVENHVDFSKNVNLAVAAVTMIVGIADFNFAIKGVTFNGIAIGSVLCLILYHGLYWLGRLCGTVLPEKANAPVADASGAGVGDLAGRVEHQEQISELRKNGQKIVASAADTQQEADSRK
jgi:uracil-xanthine permease